MKLLTIVAFIPTSFAFPLPNSTFAQPQSMPPHQSPRRRMMAMGPSVGGPFPTTSAATTTTTTTTRTVKTSYSFTDRYFDRLGLDPKELDPEPTIDKLRIIHETHLRTIPFENLAQHGAVGGPATVLDMKATAEKVLDRKRGGFCMELNGLLADLLLELGYQVKRVPAIVYQGSFEGIANHIILFVKSPTQEDTTTWFVDVGFGEPALHPLKYDFSIGPQKTPDNMQSRFVRDESDPSLAVLEWNRNQVWVPRLQWKVQDAPFLEEVGPSMADWNEALESVQHESSPFSQKIIVTKLTRDFKLTLAGNKLKCTTPRFAPDGAVSATVKELSSVEEVRDILRKEFGIPWKETEGLDLTESLQAPPAVWSVF